MNKDKQYYSTLLLSESDMLLKIAQELTDDKTVGMDVGKASQLLYQASLRLKKDK